MELGIGRYYPTVKLACFGVADCDHRQGGAAVVKSQVCLTLGGVGAVTVQAIIAENRANVAIEVNGRLVRAQSPHKCGGAQDQNADGAGKQVGVHGRNSRKSADDCGGPGMLLWTLNWGECGMGKLG
jgi:hypothetical protein